MIVLVGLGKPDMGVIMRQSKADGLVLPTLISSLFMVASFYVRIISFVEVCEYPSVEQYL